MKRKLLSTLVAGLGLAGAGMAQAQISDNVVKIGVLNDMSGIYADIAGPNSVVAARMAVEDFLKTSKSGLKVEVVSADHQNKPDVGSNIARQWYDKDGVDAIFDVPTSSVALAVSQITREKGKAFINSGAGTADLTGKACSPNTVHWTYDTWMLAHGTGSAIVKNGGDSWFFLTADYAFGNSLQEEASKVVNANGGKVLGAAKHPIAATDFASFMMTAQQSKAQIIGLANAGADTVNAVKAAREFGLIGPNSKQTLAGLLMYITDVHALGLKTASGLMLTEGFYWDMNDETRAFSKRYFAKMKKMPNMSQAGAYSSTMHYLKAVQAAKTDETAKVMTQMKSTPINDFFAKNGRIREDGRMVHDMYLFQVKSQGESKYPWDYFKLVATVPGDKAFLPLSQSKCPMVKK